MTETLYLHVGAPKSGTTYLQRVLEANRRALADAGVLVVGRTHLDRIHAAMVVRDDPRLAELGPRAASSWKRLTAQIHKWDGPRAILSYELFAGAGAEQVERALRDLSGIDVHVVVTARDFARAVPSAWQERLKFAYTTPLEEWQFRPESDGPRAEWSWRTMDPAGVAARWGRSLPPGNVHVVTVPRAGAPKDELWRRFAAACDLEVPNLDLEVDRVNESMGVVAAELLRRVNEMVTDPITGNREQARWLRDTLAHQVLVHLDKEPIGLTDEQFDDAARRSAAAIATIAEAGYDVRGDLEDLRATRPDARTPGQSTETELLAAALQTIVRLLLVLRERTGSLPADDERPEGGWKSVGKRVLSRGAAVPVGVEVDRLDQRVARLEEDLHRTRALQLRVAELTDLVSELLLPIDAGVNSGVELEALERYREESL